MQRTRARSETDITQAARRVSNRVRGDLLSIHEKFRMSTQQELLKLAHDICIGLEYDCLESLLLFLYPPGWSAPLTAYEYCRAAPGSFGQSRHSGRIERCSRLVGGALRYEVRPRCRDTWDALKPRFRIGWTPCNGTTMQGMAASPDGGYASGNLGLSRTRYRQRGY